MQLHLPKSVTLCETFLREGLQHEEIFLPTDTKVFFANSFLDAGFKRIEVGSFSAPKYLPQFKDIEEVLRRIKRVNGTILSAITINAKAIERAIASRDSGYGPDMCNLVIATSETLNVKNTGFYHNDHWQLLEKWGKMVREANMKMLLTISTIFGCPIEGSISPKKAYEFVDRALNLGSDEIELGDSTGEVSPDRAFEFYSELISKYKNPDLFVAHFHEPRGWGLANCLAALQAGATKLDSSMGGTGGQPARIVDRIPVFGTGDSFLETDVTGNVVTEDLVTLMDEMKIETNINVEKVLELGMILEKVLERRLRSFCIKSGKPKK